MENLARIKILLEILQKSYPKAKIALTYHTPWELLVAVILSAQCTDVMVNSVTSALFSKYKTLDDYVKADPLEFEKDIRKTGFYKNKAKHILATAAVIKKTFEGEVPQTMEELLTLPGVARKTANVVLGNAFGVVLGIAVDTHVIRLSQRLRLVPLETIGGKREVTLQKGDRTIIDYKKDASPEKIEKELMNILPKTQWFSFTYELIDHGRAVCKAIHPHCSSCLLASYCPVKR